MKKRMIALALALVICLSLCGNVFAATSVKSGVLTDETGKELKVFARLTVDRNTALATTEVEATDGFTVATTVILYFLNSDIQQEVACYSGTTTARTGNLRSSGFYATSQHSVNGGSKWGSWSCSLSESAGY